MTLKTKDIVIVVVIIFIISQALIVALILQKNNEAVLSINQIEQSLNEKIELNNKDIQNKINSLTESIGSVSSAQTSLQEQLGEIKATTSADFSDIIDREIKGVVTIKTDSSQGTGFLISSDGFIVTNAHVLSGARYANVHTYDSKIYSAQLIGYDLEMDVAVLKIQGTFQPLQLGDSEDVKIGEKVIAIGNPLGLSFTATEGIISAKNRVGINGLPYYFQTDVSLNPGNSGGPLINTKGDVIGINNFKISGADNIGFALEINHAKNAANSIVEEEFDYEII